MRKFYLLLLSFSFSLACFSQTIQSSGVGSGNWNDLLSWTPNTVPTSANSTAIIINNGHTITLTAIATIDQTTINSGGTLIINSGITLTLGGGTGDELTVSSGGTITNNGTIAFGGIPNRTVVLNGTFNNNGVLSGVTAAKLSFTSGSNYFHQFADGGAIPSATWNAASTVNIVGYTSGNFNPPTGLNQTFGNFIWNAPAQDVAISLDGLLTSINGSFTVTDTGTDVLYYSLGGAGGTMNIGGSLNVTGGVLGWTSGDAGPSTLNISGNLNFSSGYTQLADDQNLSINVIGNFSVSGDAQVDFAATSAITNLNLQGNYSFTGGDIFVGGTGNLNFIGASAKTFTSTLTPLGNLNYSVASLSTLNLLGSNFVAGGGNFTLSGTLQLGSTDASGALQTGISGGNIRVSGTRPYASGSTIVYNGTGAQFIGNGFPSGSDVNLVIDNASNVTLSTSLDIVALRTLTLTSGSILIGTQTLTINGTVSGSGGIVGGPSSNLVIGGTGAFGTLNFSGTNELLNFTMNRNGSINMGGDLTILGALTHTDGALVLGSNTLTISGAYARTFGTLAVTSASSIVVNGSGVLPSGSVGITGSALGTLTLNRSSSTLDVSASVAITNLNLVSGTLNNGPGLSIATGGTITRNEQGSMTTSPNNTTNAYNVVYSVTSPTPTGPELPTNTTALANFTKQGTGALTLGSDLTVNGIMILSDGSFNSGSNDVDLKGNFVSNAASTLTGSAITFSGATTITGSATPTFGIITITGVLTPSATFRINGNLVNNGTLNAGSATTIFGGTTTISGSSVSSFNDISITSGNTLTAPAGNMNVAGNWNNTGTFNNGVATNTVTFNGTTTFTGAGLTQFSGVTISGTLTSSSTLRVAGNFTNNGTFSSNSGTLLLNGSALQLLQGSTRTNFNNITISNVGGPPGVRVATNQDISGVLTLSPNVIFDPDGLSSTIVFRLRSSADDPTVDASIATLPSGAVVGGNVTIQRFMSLEGTNSRIYRYISSPVQAAAVSQIQAFIPVTGTFTVTSSCSGCLTSQSMFRYNESVITDTNGDTFANLEDGYVDFPDVTNTETFVGGTGYTLFVRGNVAPISTAGSALYELRGSIFSGIQTLPVSFTSSGTVANDGWNLVGNPYPSTIDWDAASGWTKTNLNDATYMRDNGAGAVATYVGGIPQNGGSRYISSGQAFFVKSDGGVPSLQVTEAVKVAGTQTTFFREGAIPDVLRIKLIKANLQDETVVRFSPDATEGFDGSLDAYKLKNAYFNFSSVSGETKYAINSLPNFGCSQSLALNIADATAGAYRLELSQFDSFDGAVEFSLLDQFTGKVIDVKSNPVYEFEITTEANSTGNRFNLIISLAGIDNSIVAEALESTCSNAEGYMISLPSSQLGVSYYASFNGSIISENIAGSGSNLTIGIDQSKLSVGDNNIIVFGKRASCGATPLLQTVSVKFDNVYQIQSVTNGTSCQEGAVSLMASGAPENGSYKWYESMESTDPISGSNSSSFNTPLLTKSRDYYVSAVNSLGCEGERKIVKAEVVQYEDVLISEPEYGVLTSTYSEGNVWYFNDAIIVGGNKQSIAADKSGVYKVEVTIGTCKTIDSYDFAVTAIEGNSSDGVSLYPNPVTTELTIDLRGKKVASVNLISNTGVQLHNQNVSVGMENITLDMRSNPPGLYLVKLIGIDKSVSTYKIMKR